MVSDGKKKVCSEHEPRADLTPLLLRFLVALRYALCALHFLVALSFALSPN